MKRSRPWKVGHSPNQGNFSERLNEEKTDWLLCPSQFSKLLYAACHSFYHFLKSEPVEVLFKHLNKIF